MDRKSTLQLETGVTLLELMIALLVLAISLTLGVPSMQALLHKNRLQAQSHRILGSLNLARSEAIMRNISVSICPSAMTDTGEFSCEGEYHNGWIVFSNVDRDKEVDAGSDKVLHVFEGLPQGYRLTNRAGTRTISELISYLPDGSSRKNRTLLICPPGHYVTQPLSIVINIVGRARLAMGDGQCPVT